MIDLSKPFQIGELLARVETVLRRTKRIQDKITIDDVTLDPVSRQVFKDGHQINLTVKEFDLLMELVGNKNVALSRARLYEAVWEEEYSGETRTLDSHIQRLRKKLDWNDRIVTVFRIGYRLEVPSVKFFYKIFLSMLLVLTVSLATIEYLTVSYSLEHALQREENTALSQHQMAKYSIQIVLLGITDDYTTSNMENIAKSAETPLGAQSGLFFASQNSQSGRDETVYYNSCKINPSDRIPATGILEYEIRETEKDRYLQVRSSFTLDTNSFVLVTEKNVKELFQDADTLRRRCEFFLLVYSCYRSFLMLVITFT